MRVRLYLIALFAGPAAAQSQGDSDVLRRIEALERTIEQQSRELEELRRLVAQSPTPPSESAPQIPAPETTTASQIRTAERIAELPPDQLAATEFPGSFPIPGGDAALKIGGLVRVNWVSSGEGLLVDDRFITSSIQIEDPDQEREGSRVTVMARPSRFNFDLRTPTGVGYMRAFIEADFAGSGNTLRLRHAYGQWRRAIFGQTWSTFADPEAEPDGIDFEGLNSIVLFRQAQVRWSVAPSERVRVAFALEDPRPDLTGANGVNQAPDVIARLRWEPKVGGHMQAAGLRPPDSRGAAGPSERHRVGVRMGRHHQRPPAVTNLETSRQRHVPVPTRAPASAATSPICRRKVDRTASTTRSRTRSACCRLIPVTSDTSIGGATRSIRESASASSASTTSTSRVSTPCT